MSKKRKKRSGHFCWCCGRIRANERFSGPGHARHLCKDCAGLDKAELDYCQAVRDLERHVTWEGIVRRKRRRSFEKFLSHPDARVRKYAEELAAEDVKSRAYLKVMERESEGGEQKACEFDLDCPYKGECDRKAKNAPREAEEITDEDIPF